jgi:hypothetical protein
LSLGSKRLKLTRLRGRTRPSNQDVDLTWPTGASLNCGSFLSLLQRHNPSGSRKPGVHKTNIRSLIMLTPSDAFRNSYHTFCNKNSRRLPRDGAQSSPESRPCLLLIEPAPTSCFYPRGESSLILYLTPAKASTQPMNIGIRMHHFFQKTHPRYSLASQCKIGLRN